MKKKSLLAILPLIAFFAVAFSSFKSPKSLSQQTEIPLATMQPPPCANGYTSLPEIVMGSDFKTPSASIQYHAPTSRFQASIHACYLHSSTPPWTSLNFIGTIAAAYRPTGTRVVLSNTGGELMEITIYSSGAMYAQHIGGPLPGRVAALSFYYNL